MIIRRVVLVIVTSLVASLGVRAEVRAVESPVIDISRYEGRTVESVELVIEEASIDEAALAELRARLKIAAGQRFSAVLIRESLQELFNTGRVADARVEASDVSIAQASGVQPRVTLRFHVRPHVVVNDIDIKIGVTEGTGISEEDLRARVNLLEPGMRVTEQTLRASADAIQIYLRDQGFYRAIVDYDRRLDPTRTRATVVFDVEPGPPTRLEAFNIRVQGFDHARLFPELPMQPGDIFTMSGLAEMIARTRRAIISEGYLAPQLSESFQYDAATNRITATLRGAIGPRVEVEVEGYDVGEKRERELLPVKREGTIEPSAIEEGARRLKNRLQEEGYFFAEVTYACTVRPPLPNAQTMAAPNGDVFDLCELLDPGELSGSTVNIKYNVERGRRFKLTEIRLEGTDALDKDEIVDDLRTQEANILDFLPFLGYGRGYTNEEALARDERTIESRMRDLGYRRADVTVRQGVSLEGENLIITFVVEQGPLTRVAGIEMRGNQIYTAEKLRDARCPANPLPDETCMTQDAAFSRAQARADGERLRAHYLRNGYADAEVLLSVIELPAAPDGGERVRLIYNITEADKVFINRIRVHGLVQTKEEAVLEAIPLREGAVLRGDELLESERVLLNSTDAFRQVLIRTESAGETAGGFKRRDVVIDVQERKSITTDYIVGFSTDNGPLFGFDLRHVNLFGELKQGALRSRFSRRQQLVRLEFFDPRFRRYGDRAFAPLTASVQYQRDTSVTRFFRSTIDRGSGGVVQRFDEEGKLIDEFGKSVGAPSINRFTASVETQRDLELDLSPSGAVRKRTTLFLRYNYEDVRLFNIGSLLIAPLLRPDQAVRLSRLGVSFARDTRDRQFDPTSGSFVTVDYGVALKALGGNISFNKLLTTFSTYYKVNRVRETVLAANVQLGLANVFSASDRNRDGVIDDADKRLPISERFFSGGSTTLRGFSFEEAGPRLAFPECAFGPQPAPTPLPPCGTFRNEKGEVITLNPFTVPVGGNAVAVVNLEARVGVTREIQLVPFYDGGNVYEKAGDLFGKDGRPGRNPNLDAKWTHTVGLGLRLKTPIGSLGVDYGYLLNPPEFVIPQFGGATAIHRLPQSKIHFRFGQTF